MKLKLILELNAFFFFNCSAECCLAGYEMKFIVLIFLLNIAYVICHSRNSNCPINLFLFAWNSMTFHDELILSTCGFADYADLVCAHKMRVAHVMLYNLFLTMLWINLACAGRWMFIATWSCVVCILIHVGLDGLQHILTW